LKKEGDVASEQASLAARFREQHRAGRLLLPNAWDAASARVLEEAGFQAIGTTSAGIAYTQGFQDGEHVGRDAMVRVVATIVQAVSCPVTADIEGGYGVSAADVAQTVEAVMDAGAVGFNLEDCAHGPVAGRLIGIDGQCARIAATREVADRRGVRDAVMRE
jgi:2-methylisocitrate lyase-like PEP mutase family enzyme